MIKVKLNGYDRDERKVFPLNSRSSNRSTFSNKIWPKNWNSSHFVHINFTKVKKKKNFKREMRKAEPEFRGFLHSISMLLIANQF